LIAVPEQSDEAYWFPVKETTAHVVTFGLNVHETVPISPPRVAVPVEVNGVLPTEVQVVVVERLSSCVPQAPDGTQLTRAPTESAVLQSAVVLKVKPKELMPRSDQNETVGSTGTETIVPTSVDASVTFRLKPR
jgi:hypothetical protein